MSVIKPSWMTVVVAAVLVCSGTVAPAYADDPTHSPEEVAALVDEAARLAAPDPLTEPSGEVSVDTSADPSAGVEMSNDEGTSLTVSLPGNVVVSNGDATDGGVIVYTGAEGSPDVTVEPLADGVRVTTVLDSDTTARASTTRSPKMSTPK